MDRPKQQAAMFLLGAILVGGVLGFSAAHVWGRGPQRSWAQRTVMYDDLGLNDKQRTSMDSLLDDSNCQINLVISPVQPMLDSIHANAKRQMRGLMTPEQQAVLDDHVRKDSVRRASRRPSRQPRQEACKK